MMENGNDSNQSGQNNVETGNNDKEQNLGRMRQKYEYALSQEIAKREQLETRLNELSQQTPHEEDDSDNPDPYVDHKKLDKKLNKFGQNTQKEIKNAMEQAKFLAKEELKQEMFLENHADFFDVLENHAENFHKNYPKLANNILKLPAGFERQQVVYQTIKDLEIDKPIKKEISIQEKVDANRRSPYYQPSGVVGSAPYSQVGDFSQSGQKSAYDKMKDLQKRMRL